MTELQQREFAAAVTLLQTGRFAEAEKIGRRLVAASPNQHEFLTLAGLAALSDGRPSEAIDVLSRAAAIVPDAAVYHSNLGEALRRANEIDAARSEFERAVSLDPNLRDALVGLGLLETVARRFDVALAHLRNALTLQPNDATVLLHLGEALLLSGRAEEALRPLRRATSLASHPATAFHRLGRALHDLGRYTESMEASARAFALDPSNHFARHIYAASANTVGRLSEALACYREGLQRRPDDAVMHSNVLFMMMYPPDVSETERLAEHRKWWVRHGEPRSRSIEPFANDRNPDRTLRIGYLSPSFREHPIAFFVPPILAHHNPDSCAVTCYHDSSINDAFTDHIKSSAKGEWVDVHAMSDDALAARVREDRIDILVDLNQHMAGNRMKMLSRRCAPVQVAYLGYPYTTGLPTIDYRLSDPYLDPPDRDPSGEVERIARMPQSYLCYEAPAFAPDIEPSVPSERVAGGTITFGSFNQLLKLHGGVIETWARVMRAVPGSRILIKAQGMSDPLGRRALAEQFARHEIAADRVDFEPHTPLRDAMESFGRRVDVALDTFPYPGGTTNCHLLWMGVPVITMAGELPFQRLGLTVLANAGFEKGVARNADEYVDIAVRIAGDVEGRLELRRSIRSTMRASPLMDAVRFTRDLESLYRQMWRTWCESGKSD